MQFLSTLKKGFKIKSKHNIKKIKPGAIMAIILSMGIMQPMSVYAAEVSGVTSSIDSLKNLMISVVGGIGVIVLIYNIWNLSQAYQSHDTAAFSQAIKGCVGGFIMASISAIMTFLGY